MMFSGNLNGSPVRVLLGFFLAILIPVCLVAQLADGKIEGFVRDKDTGQPLAGAQVVVEGTNLGNVTNDDGYYFILNVLPGLRTITASYTGYQKTSIGNQRILAGHTATVNFNLSSSVISLEGIVIEGDAAPLIQRDNVQTRQHITMEETVEVPYEDLNSIIGMQAGIRREGEFSFTIRGGRRNEEAVYVDGVLVRNFSTGINEQSPGVADNSTMIKISPNAIEEVSIITGGFHAEYGNAQSGVVNIVTRSGGDQLSGSVYYKTDGMLPAENSYGFNQLRANIGGPFLAPNSRFFTSMEMRGTKDTSPRRGEEYGRFMGITPRFYDGFNKLMGGYLTDNGIGLADLPKFPLPKWGERVGEEGDEYLFSAKVNLPVGDRISTLWTYTQNRNQQMDFSLQNNLRNMPGREANFVSTKHGVMGLDWDIAKSASSSYSLRFRFSGYENEIHDGPIDPKWADSDGNTIGELDFRDGDLIDGRSTFFNFNLSDYDFLFGDMYDKMLPDAINAKYGVVSRWDQNLPTSAATGNLYWGWGTLVNGGTSVDVLNQRERNATIKLDLDMQIDRYNRAKMGIDAKIINMKGINLTNFGGIYSGNTQNYYDAHPLLLSAYIQDRVDLGDLVVDFGLRWDRMDPRSQFPAVAGEGPTGTQVDAPVRNVISPRVGVAHPVTDRTQFRFSYGHFYQPPPFDLMFSQKNAMSLYSWSMTGDKDLDFSKTTAFEVGFTSLLSDDLVLDMVGYYRDFEGNLAVRFWIPAYDSSPLPFYCNQDYGNSKGIDLTLKRRMVKYLSFQVTYSMQIARGTGSVPNFYINPGRLTYETTGEYIMPPVRYWPVGNDRTHSLAAQFNLRLPDDFQQGSALGSVLKNSSYFFIQGFGTGGFTSVRTPEALSGARVTLIDPNSLRGKSSKYTHLRLRKRFPFGKQMSLSAFCEIRNLIQWDSRKGYFPASNAQLDVIQKELSVGSGGVAGTSYIGSYKADRVAAYEGNPVAMQQARQRDYNKDGSISRSEQFVAERLNRAIIDGWNAGGTPRLWRFGFQFDF